MVHQIVAMLFICSLSLSALAAEKATADLPLRVGGTYEVSSIAEIENGFKIEFQSVAKSGKYDTLILESDHVHFSVKLGQKIRLSAEILSAKGSEAEVSQVLIFLPSVQGPVPVWLLSKKNKGDLIGSKYIEMHAPQSDYSIF